MKRTTLLIAGLILCISGASVQAAEKVPKPIAAAVADSSRPEADTKRDADRKPGESVAFAGVKAGQKVVDLLPGGGYFTRIFSKVVGPKGKVYALIPEDIIAKNPKAADRINAVAAEKGYENVKVTIQMLAQLKFDEPVDVVWTSQNYHDLKNAMFGPADTVAMNKAIFAALKPGGTYIVLDHVAAPGANVTETLHRIDPAVVKKEAEEAGFVFAGSSDILKHPADDHTVRVVESGIRGKTDQFIYKFTKPKK